MTQPTAMAGAYGNRLFSFGALIAAAFAPPLATSVPVRASVCCSRPRIAATATARMPPAMAVNTKARRMCEGPTSVPIAANNFTSPAPIAPKTKPGSINARPTPRPASAAPTEMPLKPVTASARPTDASRAFRTFGTRRVRTSIAAAVSAPATIVASTMKSNDLANAAPENLVNRVAQRRDAEHGDRRDQRGEQSVFDQVLSLVPQGQASDRRDYLGHESRLSRTRDGAAVPRSI